MARTSDIAIRPERPADEDAVDAIDRAVGVLPGRQCSGVGTALLWETIQRATAAGEDVVVLIGHPEYYPRFRFVPASRLGITPPFHVGDAFFMARELRPGSVGGGGRFAYPAVFETSVD